MQTKKREGRVNAHRLVTVVHDDSSYQPPLPLSNHPLGFPVSLVKKEEIKVANFTRSHVTEIGSLPPADVEKLAELSRKFRVAIVLAANVSPAAMLRSNRPRGMAGINAMMTIARTVGMIVLDLDIANAQRV